MKKLILLTILALLIIPLNTSAALNTKSINLVAASSQSLSITDAAQTGLDITGDMTVMGWIEFDSTANEQDLFRKRGNANQNSYQFYWFGAQNRFYLDVWSDGTTNTSESVDFTASIDTWYHIAMVYDASAGSYELFIDGTSIATSGTTLANSIHSGTSPVQVGGNNSGGDTWNGRIDELGIYNAVLADATILADYNSGNGTNRGSGETSIVAGWRFEDDLLDETANNNDLTNNNSATFSTDVPFAGSAPVTIRRRVLEIMIIE